MKRIDKLKFIPNIITSLRIIGSLALVFLNAKSVLFIFVYIFCGLTDMADGFIARRFDCETKHGGTLDGIADFIFMAVCVLKLINIINIPSYIFVWILIILLVKIINIFIGLIKRNESAFLHTKLNKLMGMMLFVFPLTINIINTEISLPVLCFFATVTALNESCILKTRSSK